MTNGNATQRENSISLSLASLADSLAVIADGISNITAIANNNQAIQAAPGGSQEGPNTLEVTATATINLNTAEATVDAPVFTPPVASAPTPSLSLTSGTVSAPVTASAPVGGAATVADASPVSPPANAATTHVVLGPTPVLPAPAPVLPAHPPVFVAPTPAALATILSGVPVGGDRWYVVSKGLRVGVFQGWHNTGPFVTGVSRACYLKHNSKQDAITAYQEAYDSGSVEVLH